MIRMGYFPIEKKELFMIKQKLKKTISFYSDKKNIDKISSLSKKKCISKSEAINNILSSYFDDNFTNRMSVIESKLNKIESLLESLNSTMQSEEKLAQIHSDNTRAFALRDSILLSFEFNLLL